MGSSVKAFLRQSQLRFNSLRDDVLAALEAHRVFLSVSGAVITATSAFYTLEYRKYQQQKLERRIKSLQVRKEEEKSVQAVCSLEDFGLC